MEIWFYQLNPTTQQQILNYYGVLTPEELGLHVEPLTVLPTPEELAASRQQDAIMAQQQQTVIVEQPTVIVEEPPVVIAAPPVVVVDPVVEIW